MKTRAAGLLCALIIAIGIFINIWEPRKKPTASAYHPEVPTLAVLAADPMLRIDTLRNIPTLLIYDDHDPIVPSITNAVAAHNGLDTHSQSIVYAGSDHIDPRIFNPDIVMKFLNNIPQDTVVVLLHGHDATGSDWFDPNSHRLSKRNRKTVSSFGNALRKQYRCESGDFAGNAWGNDEAVHSLEELTAKDRKVALIGCSMGGVLMLRYAEAHPDKVVAMVGLSPVCSLESMCRTWFGSDIVRAYSEPIPKRVSLTTY